MCAGVVSIAGESPSSLNWKKEIRLKLMRLFDFVNGAVDLLMRRCGFFSGGGLQLQDQPDNSTNSAVGFLF